MKPTTRTREDRDFLYPAGCVKIRYPDRFDGHQWGIIVQRIRGVSENLYYLYLNGWSKLGLALEQELEPMEVMGE